MNCTIITVGDEILVGQIIDTNSAWLGVELNTLGVDVVEILSVSDKADAITEALKRAVNRGGLILMTGGLGPTKDDITKKTIADFFNVGMSFHQDTYDRLVQIFAKFNRSISKSQEHQCFMPDNAVILANNMGTAPGMLFTYNDTTIVSMPGVPFEMKYLFTTYLVPYIKDKISDDFVIHHKTIMTFGQGESYIAEAIDDLVEGMPNEVSIAYLPSLAHVRLRITGKGDRGIVNKVEGVAAQIAERVRQYVYGFDNETLEQAVKRLADIHKVTIGTAESCTGGYLGYRLTSVPGSSTYYMGGVVTYSNAMKMNLLNVSSKTLEKFGAVSSETVIEMAEGCIKTCNVDIAISISGIAGPDGGTPDKPVGTIWLAIAQRGYETKSVLIKASKDRSNNVIYAGNVGMGLILKRLLNMNR